MESLPDHLICNILAFLPFTKEKVALQLVNRRWNHVMCQPASHAVSCDDVLYWKKDTIKLRVLRVLPHVRTAHNLEQRLEGNLGLERIQRISSCVPDVLASCPHLPSVVYLCTYSSIDMTYGTHFASKFPKLEYLSFVDLHLNREFLMTGLQNLAGLQTFHYAVHKPKCEGHAQSAAARIHDIPAVSAPESCLVELILGPVNNPTIPACTARSLSNITIDLVAPQDCVVRLARYTKCHMLEHVTYHVYVGERLEDEYKPVHVTFAGLSDLPQSVKTVQFIAHDVFAGLSVHVAPEDGWWCHTATEESHRRAK